MWFAVGSPFHRLRVSWDKPDMKHGEHILHHCKCRNQDMMQFQAANLESKCESEKKKKICPVPLPFGELFQDRVFMPV